MPAKTHNSRTKIIVAVIGVCVAVALGFSLYRLGQKSGEEARSDQIAELAASVKAKSDTLEKLNSVMSDVPETVDQEGIATYISNLQGLINETSDESIKTALADYLAKWQHLQDIYGSKDNAAITQAFETIQSSTSVTATQIQQTLDSRITSALNALGN